MALPFGPITFTAANGTALTTYDASFAVNAGDFAIQSNGLCPNGATASTDCAARWDDDVFPDDQWVEWDWTSFSGGGVNERAGGGVRIARDGSANYAGIEYDDDTGDLTFFEVVSGVKSQLGAVLSAPALGSRGRLEVKGSTLEYFEAGVSRGTRTTSLTSGNAGAVGRGISAAQRIDNLDGGAFSISEQEGYQFRNDDGSESTATSLAAENTDVTQPDSTNTRLRILLDATGDPSSEQYQLEYKKSSDSTWLPVGQGAPGTPTDATLAAAGTTAEDTSLGTIGFTNPANATAQDDTYATSVIPGHGSTYFLLLTNFGASIPAGATITGFEVEVDHFSSAAGVRLTSVYMVKGGVVAAGTDHGADATNLATADTDSYLTYPGTGGSSDLWGQSWTDADVNASDFGVALRYRNNNAAARTVDIDHVRVIVYYTPNSPAAIDLAASSNIASSGEATTAQLTPPSGKTTSDFIAGEIQDDQNPTDAIDITADAYTELEWCMSAVSGVVTDGDVYQFRVTKAGAVLDTYTVTPEWTIGSGGAPAFSGSGSASGASRVIASGFKSTSGAGLSSAAARTLSSGSKGAVSFGSVSSSSRVTALGASAPVAAGFGIISSSSKVTASGIKGASSSALVRAASNALGAGAKGAIGSGIVRDSTFLLGAGIKATAGAGVASSSSRVIAFGSSGAIIGGSGKASSSCRVIAAGFKNTQGQARAGASARAIAIGAQASSTSSRSAAASRVTTLGFKSAAGAVRVSAGSRADSTGSKEAFGAFRAAAHARVTAIPTAAQFLVGVVSATSKYNVRNSSTSALEATATGQSQFNLRSSV